MNLFNVYERFDITPVKAEGCYVYGSNGEKYLDLYGGHGVISVGHNHPVYTKAISDQMSTISFYSNSVIIPIQSTFAEKLSKVSGYPDYNLFLCNSGAEANENALKLASFHTKKSKVIAFKNSFHGRTSAALNVTDNNKISAPINKQGIETIFVEINDIDELKKAFDTEGVCAAIIEGIQGVGGLDEPSEQFLGELRSLCDEYQVVLILDEIQSGYFRSGKFFAHHFSGIKADIISMAKGMGNGFPIGGILIHPDIEASYGLLGTTFGGNYLACAAGCAVLDILNEENSVENVNYLEMWLREELTSIAQIKKVKGKGLMLGIEFDFPIKELRTKLLFDSKIFTGASMNPNLLRILPPLTVKQEELIVFIQALKQHLS
ncbi:MAG: aspartate aminotransferase family protein [Crocinitomicaceae bacterium]|nr:aspartate aminotransferase family protein [Crocinitomicaceae bacterium]